jgi:hypothetical protein
VDPKWGCTIIFTEFSSSLVTTRNALNQLKENNFMGTYREMAKQKSDEELLEALEGYKVDSPPADQIRMELTGRHFQRLTAAIVAAGKSTDRLAKVGNLIAIIGVVLAIVGVFQTCTSRG